MFSVKDCTGGSRDFPPGYLAIVAKLERLIPEWCAAFPTGLPDLRFWHPGRFLIACPLDASHSRLLAISPDAFALLAWLDEQTNREATLLQAFCVLDHLGYMKGMPTITLEKIEELGFSRVGMLTRGGSA